MQAKEANNQRRSPKTTTQQPQRPSCTPETPQRKSTSEGWVTAFSCRREADHMPSPTRVASGVRNRVVSPSGRNLRLVRQREDASPATDTAAGWTSAGVQTPDQSGRPNHIRCRVARKTTRRGVTPTSKGISRSKSEAGHEPHTLIIPSDPSPPLEGLSAPSLAKADAHRGSSLRPLGSWGRRSLL